MREQKGHLWRKGQSWFLRFCDDVMQPDGTVARKQVCKKLKVGFGGAYRTKKSVQGFVREILDPLNQGLLNAQSTMPVSEFVERVYFPEYVMKDLKPSTRKQYRDTWGDHLKGRIGSMTLRDFRTVHAQQLLADIARQSSLGRHSLKHIKSLLSGIFKQAKRLGILDGTNPIQDVSIPLVPEPEEDTYAYNLLEIKSMLAVLDEPARTVVLTAALSGLRKSELLGLRWQDFNGTELTVRRSVWNGIVGEPKTKRSKAPIPVVKQLADALEAHRLHAGILAQPDLPIFQSGNGKPLNLDNLASRVIRPMLAVSKIEWHGWRAFRRGLATNLHALGVDDRTIQAILRHSNIGLTQGIYIKSLSADQVTAMDAIGEKLEKLATCNQLATPAIGPVN
jgi:integrase